ncbi:hypothetical protein [Longispora albida]|uniref:hypothetical protein n=1 Tax=Longispora albida TaxID=203523 RepID=UPI0012FAC3F5|nr:hypothetical protein [Longispora albida]
MTSSLHTANAAGDPLYGLVASRLREAGPDALAALEDSPSDPGSQEQAATVLAAVLDGDPDFAATLRGLLAAASVPIPSTASAAPEVEEAPPLWPAPPAPVAEPAPEPPLVPAPAVEATPPPPAFTGAQPVLDGPVPQVAHAPQPGRFQRFYASVGAGGLAAILAGSVFYLLVGAGAGLLLAGSGSPSDVAEDFMAAAVDGDFDEVLSLSCASDTDTEKEREQLRSSVDAGFVAASIRWDLMDRSKNPEEDYPRVRAELKKLTFTAVRASEHGDFATVWLKVEHPSPKFTATEITVPAVREDGDWKVCYRLKR